MRIEKDFLGEVSIPAGALYGIHSYRARQNFSNPVPFPIEWYKATGLVKLACYRTVRKLLKAIEKEHPDLIDHLRLPTEKILGAMEGAASEVSSGSHFEYFIVPGELLKKGFTMNDIRELL